MADPRFFHLSGPKRLEEILAATDAHLAVDADQAKGRLVRDIAPLDAAGADDVSFLDNTAYLEAFAASKAGYCFVRPKYAARAPASMLALLTDDPYTAFAKISALFYAEKKAKPFISPSAQIDPSAAIADGCRIEAGAVIGAKAEIGAGSVIGAHAVIGDGVVVGEHARIGAHVTLSHTIAGKRLIVHPGARIGQDGFGFAPSATGILKVPQLGRVMIGDDVEIGANTCIDRGAGPDTVIGHGCKIDNLVQIGHNVRLGRFVIIAGQAGVSGSVRVEDGAMLGGQAGVAGHLTVGAKARLAAQSGVAGDIPAGATYGGAPAVPIRDWHRQTRTLARLIKRAGGDE